jgi:hypothetical protein
MADMNNSDAARNITQGKQRQRKPRQKKLLPAPLLRLIVVFVAVVVIVVVIVVAVTASRGNDEAVAYQRYMGSVTDILKQSDAVGTKLSALLTNPGDTNRKTIQASLDDYVAASKQLEARAKALQAPSALVQQNVNQFFVLVMTFRREGLESLEPELINALDTQDSDVVAQQISDSLGYLTNSDFLYKTVFVKGATDIVKEKNIAVTVPASKFLQDPDLASASQVQQIIAQLKSTGNLQAVHGVAVTKVMAQPDNQQIKNGQTYNLTASDQLAFLVSVTNQGNMSEKNVPVVVTLGTDAGGKPQSVTVTIPEIKPGKQVTATVQGLNPTQYGEEADLTVKTGPVAGEKVTDNNSLDATVIFKL